MGFKIGFLYVSGTDLSFGDRRRPRMRRRVGFVVGVGVGSELSLAGHRNHPLANIIEECVDIMREMDINVNHIRRTNNIWADGLARLGRLHEHEYTEYEEIPDALPLLLERVDQRNTIVSLQASIDPNYHIATFGAYILDDMGKWKCGLYGRLRGTPDILRALMEGLYHCLHMAKMRGWKDIMIETDSHELIEIFKGVQYRETNFENIRIDCYELMRSVGADFTYAHSGKIRGADWLAREARLQEDAVVEIMDIPAAMRWILDNPMM